MGAQPGFGVCLMTSSEDSASRFRDIVFLLRLRWFVRMIRSVPSRHRDVVTAGDSIGNLSSAKWIRH